MLTRKDALEVLRHDGLSIEGQQGYHMLTHAALRVMDDLRQADYEDNTV